MARKPKKTAGRRRRREGTVQVDQTGADRGHRRKGPTKKVVEKRELFAA